MHRAGYRSSLGTTRAINPIFGPQTHLISGEYENRIFNLLLSAIRERMARSAPKRSSVPDNLTIWSYLMLPDFIIIGAHKAGTTSLHHYFDQHPDVFMTVVKEPNYFSFDPMNAAHVGARKGSYRVKSLSDYEALFKGAPLESRRGEASPSYLHSRSAPTRIKELLPECRLIVSLRNPVDRAYSAYQMAFRAGVTKMRVEDIEPGLDSWTKKSLYAESLSRYLKIFSDSRLRVVLFEDLIENPSETMRDLFNFIEVRTEIKIDTSYRFNPGGLPRSSFVHHSLNSLKKIPLLQEFAPKTMRRKLARFRDGNLQKAEPLNPEIRRIWLEYFFKDITRTQTLIGRDLSGWTL